jgi:hypothetical protein
MNAGGALMRRGPRIVGAEYSLETGLSDFQDDALEAD